MHSEPIPNILVLLFLYFYHSRHSDLFTNAFDTHSAFLILEILLFLSDIVGQEIVTCTLFVYARRTRIGILWLYRTLGQSLL